MAVEKIKEGNKIIGTMVRLTRNPAIAKLAAASGLDFIMMDMEHGPYSLETLSDIFKVAGSIGLGGFVRVPELSKGYVSRVLDAGANGIMVPMIESAEQAEKLAEWSKYAPLGKRGFGGSGGHTDFIGMGGRAPDFMKEANKQILTIAQIESKSAVDEIEKIAQVDGIDALLIGPNDLAISLGCPGDLTGNQVNDAIEKIVSTAHKRNKIVGMHSGDALLQRWIPRGMTLIMNSMDINILSAGMRSIVEKYSR